MVQQLVNFHSALGMFVIGFDLAGSVEGH